MIDFQEAFRRIVTPAAANQLDSGRPAFIQAADGRNCREDRVVTYAQFQALTDRAQAALASRGVGAGAIVLICQQNSPELAALIFACWRLGAIALPVDYRLTRPEVENIVSRVGARVVCLSEKSIPSLAVLTPADWPESGEGLPAQSAPDADSFALIILTSGTTGIPKGAVHQIGSLINNVSEMGSAFGLSDSDRSFLPLPVSHIFGIEVMMAALLYGGATIFADFNPSEFWNTVARLRSTMIVGVPTIYGALLSMPSPPKDDIAVEWYLSGGAPLPPTANEDFEKRFGRRIVQGYGTTETKILCFNKEGPLASVGRPLPSVAVEIVDEAGNVLPEGQQGEICIRGPSLMHGYLGQPEATASVLNNGRYHTGDIGYLADGYLYIAGRLKEMIIVAGNKVFPLEVEGVLRRHTLAAEVAVVGVPHTRLGQLVKAVVVIKPGPAAEMLEADAAAQKAARQELLSKFRLFCQENLKRELRPMEWEFRPPSRPLPKTLTGKIDKKQLETA